MSLAALIIACLAFVVALSALVVACVASGTSSALFDELAEHGANHAECSHDGACCR